VWTFQLSIIICLFLEIAISYQTRRSIWSSRVLGVLRQACCKHHDSNLLEMRHRSTLSWADDHLHRRRQHLNKRQTFMSQLETKASHPADKPLETFFVSISNRFFSLWYTSFEKTFKSYKLTAKKQSSENGQNTSSYANSEDAKPYNFYFFRIKIYIRFRSDLTQSSKSSKFTFLYKQCSQTAKKNCYKVPQVTTTPYFRIFCNSWSNTDERLTYFPLRHLDKYSSVAKGSISRRFFLPYVSRNFLWWFRNTFVLFVTSFLWTERIMYLPYGHEKIMTRSSGLDLRQFVTLGQGT
jgi:hypothetical protein